MFSIFGLPYALNHGDFFPTDVGMKNTVEAARKVVEDLVGNKGLTLLINNAAVLAPQRFPQITEENLVYHYKANTIGPTIVIQVLLLLLLLLLLFSNEFT